MEFLKELFTEPLTFEAFSKAVSDKGYKLANLSGGEYVDKKKLTDALFKNKELTEQLSTLSGDMQELKDSNATAEDYKSKFEQLQADIARKEEEFRTAAADKELTDKILEVFPKDKDFTSEYVKNGLIADIKARHAEDNTKGLQAIFDELTKDKDGIFMNQNPVGQMTGMGEVDTSVIDTAKARSIMGLSNE